MERDFEQIIGDTRRWLRSKKPKITKNNPTQKFGRYRSDFDLQISPDLCLSVFEVSSIIGNTLLLGGVEVVEAVSTGGEAQMTQMTWCEDEIIRFYSPLTGLEVPVGIDNLSGVVLDRLYAHIAFPLSKALNSVA